MNRIVKPMPPEMKRALERRRLAEEVNGKINAQIVFRTKFAEPKNRDTLILPENFTGSDLKRAKTLIKQYAVKKAN